MSQAYRCCLFDTVVGWMGVAGTESGLTALVFPCPAREEAWNALTRECSGLPVEEDTAFREVGERLRRYFAGEAVDFRDLPVDISWLTPFQQQVLEETRAIPYGRVETYTTLARRAGRLNAIRAVGQALARNPVPIMIPCHRVLRSDGSLGGFTGGLDWKRKLLHLEGAIPPCLEL